ncbi:MAG: helix-turn-helix domain-containing protein [Bradymonadaceae bacterium]
MERKIEDSFLDQSLGFPVMLMSVPMKRVRDEWMPDLPLNEFQQVVLWILVHGPSSLTGKQVRFIRHWMEKTQHEFAAMHDVTHAAVSKWEAKGHEPTGMSKPTEVLLRLNVLTSLPAELWDRFEGSSSTDSKPASLKRLLEEVGQFDEEGLPAEPLTVPESYIAWPR